MKKVLFYLPAIIYTIAVITLNIILNTFSPLWYAWVVLLLLSGILLCKGKVWGGMFGLLPSIHLLYMSRQYTGQVINIEMPLGVVTALYVLICTLVVWRKDLNKQHKKQNE